MIEKANIGLIAIITVCSLIATNEASAQVNCNVLPHGQARANCYARESQIYQQQSQYYNGIAQDQYRQHQQIGRVLRQAPIFGGYAAPAWNAPRYIHNYRYGRP